MCHDESPFRTRPTQFRTSSDPNWVEIIGQPTANLQAIPVVGPTALPHDPTLLQHRVRLGTGPHLPHGLVPQHQGLPQSHPPRALGFGSNASSVRVSPLNPAAYTPNPHARGCPSPARSPARPWHSPAPAAACPPHDLVLQQRVLQSVPRFSLVTLAGTSRPCCTVPRSVASSKLGVNITSLPAVFVTRYVM